LEKFIGFETAQKLYHPGTGKRRPCPYFAGVELFGDVEYGVCQAQAPPLLIELRDGITINQCELNNRSCDNLPKPPSQEAK